MKTITHPFPYVLATLFALALLVTSPTWADTEQPPSIANSPSLSEHELNTLLVDLANDYFQLTRDLRQYRALFAERGDGRGFNVWHLRQFSPTLAEKEARYQAFEKQYAAALRDRPEKILFDAFYELNAISVDVMVSVRENQPDVGYRANERVRLASEQFLEILQARGVLDAVDTTP